MTEPFGQWRWQMLQRTKVRETSQFAVVRSQEDVPDSQSGAAQAAEARAPGTEDPQGRGPEVPAIAAPVSRKARAAAALKANRKRLLMGVAAVLLLGAGWFGYEYATVGRFIVSTDDAYVRADATTLAAKVSGYVAAIAVADNTRVRAGDVIARIDDVDYRLALDAARDKVATQQATVARIGEQITAQQAAVAQAKAQIASTQAVERRTQSELRRQQALAGKE
ncbi:MAG TPA: biotin/lipoyl-binding protein, partial [Bradyrhizobium sp.]